MPAAGTNSLHAEVGEVAVGSTQALAAMRALLVAAVCVVTLPEGLDAQASADLMPGSRIESAIEKLVGFGLIDNRVYGIRPWSRNEALELLDLARANLPGLDPIDRVAAEEVLANLPSSILDRRAGADLVGGIMLLNSPWADVPEGPDGIDAEINPLVRYRGGRDYLDGEMTAIEVSTDARLGDRFVVQATPRFWAGRDATDSGRGGAQLLDAQMRSKFGGLLVDVGRLRSVWGPGRDGGTLLSGNARGLDGVRVSSDRPFSWPGFLSFLGPSQGELFVSFLEEDRDIPRSRLVGYKLSVRPHPLVEASFSTVIQSGGSGAPTAGTWERIADHLLLIDWVFNGGETLFFSNKTSAIGLRFRAPPLRSSQFFLEFTLEDRAHNLRRLFWQDAAWLVGAWVPRLNRSGLLDLRLELHHGGVRLHRHGQFTSGRTLDRRLLGMGGPDTNGGLVELGVDDGGRRLSFQLAAENRSSDVWTIRFRDDRGIDVFAKTDNLPDELYLRGIAAINLFGTDGRELRIGAGVERVSDSLFEDGSVRFGGLVEVSARLPLGGR